MRGSAGRRCSDEVALAAVALLWEWPDADEPLDWPRMRAPTTSSVTAGLAFGNTTEADCVAEATEASADVADVALGPSLAAAPDFDEASQPTGMPQTNTTDGKTQLKRYCGAIAL